MRKSALLLSAFGIGLILLFAIIYPRLASQNASHSDSIRQGWMDLTGWDFEHGGAVKLDGLWEFYWNELLPPGESGHAPSYYPVPGNWPGRTLPEGERVTGHGAATYRLHLKVPPSSLIYGLKVSNIRMASDIYVNGVRVGGDGGPAQTAEAYEYGNKPFSVFFPIEGDNAEIVIHAANFEFPQGGIPYSLYFGSAQAIYHLNERTLTLNIVVIVALFLLGFYHLCVYMTRREQTGLLYFGLYCLAAGLAFSCNGDRIFLQYVNLPLEVFYKIYIASLFCSLILVMLFVKTMCAGLLPKWFSYAVAYGMGLYVCFVLATPFRVYSQYNMQVGYVQMAVYIVVIVVLTLSWFKGRYGNFSRSGLGLFILALYCFLVGLVGYGLYIAGVVPDYYVGYFAILGFCMLIALLLSFSFSEAYRTIERMSRKLQEADRLKDEFLVQTSHEFQTPLNGMINLSHAMLDGSSGTLSAPQRKNISLIMDTSRRLSALVQDILALEKIKRNEFQVRQAATDVRMLVSVVFELLSYLTAGKSVILKNEIPGDLPPVYADEDRLKQVIYNLVGNALKFTEAGEITLSARHDRHQVTLFVEDTGIGIPKEKWEDIFQSFETVRNQYSDGYGSTGLGLYISRKLLTLMGGGIRVDWSEPGRGTRMAVSLPVAEGHPAAVSVRHAWDQAASGKEAYDLLQPKERVEGKFTVLAVDDEPSNLQVISSLFAGECNMLFAANGRDALDMLRQERDIDLVLLDVMMPGMTGYEVCRKIRERFSLFELPVMLMTVRNSAQDISTGFEAGANDYIVKPFDANEIRARTETLLQLKRSVGEAIKARMDFLQSQIKPHFLFNSLNAILSFCRTDSARAEQLIIHLSDYLRRSFDPGIDVYIEVGDELQLVRAYVEIEKARFEERLQMQYEVDEQALGISVLPLTIQPLVENAIRHGIMKKEDGGTVWLTVKAEGDAVRVEVRDDGVGIPSDELPLLLGDSEAGAVRHKRGVGLANIHRRLIHFFGEGLTVSSSPGEWTAVTFRAGRRRSG